MHIPFLDKPGGHQHPNVFIPMLISLGREDIIVSHDVPRGIAKIAACKHHIIFSVSCKPFSWKQNNISVRTNTVKETQIPSSK